jgi:hypothetical protein
VPSPKLLSYQSLGTGLGRVKPVNDTGAFIRIGLGFSAYYSCLNARVLSLDLDLEIAYPTLIWSYDFLIM